MTRDAMAAFEAQALDPNNRAALQGLITLAGAVGIGALLTSFFPKRKASRGGRSGIAMFELFVVAAVLTAAATTAYICLALLHEGDHVSSRELTEASMPLVVSVFALVLLSAISRLPSTMHRAITVAPVALAAVALAAIVGSETWFVPPEHVYRVAVVIFALAALFGWATWRLELNAERNSLEDEMEQHVERTGAGYEEVLQPLLLPVPVALHLEEKPMLACWTREGRCYLDEAAARNLQVAVTERWQAWEAGQAAFPAGSSALARVKIKKRIPAFRSRARLILVLWRTDKANLQSEIPIDAESDGLFEITDLGIVELLQPSS
jgi:hypothetical protein